MIFGFGRGREAAALENRFVQSAELARQAGYEIGQQVEAKIGQDWQLAKLVNCYEKDSVVRFQVDKHASDDPEAGALPVSFGPDEIRQPRSETLN